MGSIQQRFEVEQPVASVYDAIARPHTILQRLPAIMGVTRVADGIYRLSIGAGDAPREVEVQVASNDALRRVEWRTHDGSWIGSVTAEPIGPARTAVGIHAESSAPENEHPSATLVHDTLQAFKRALQSQDIRISRPDATSGGRVSTARRFAADWREAARSALERPAEYPFTFIRTVSRQMDRLWEQMWRGTPVARLPHMMPGFVPWNPDVEVCEQNDQVRVCFDVPGVDESNLQVEIEEGALTVRGERHDERRSDPGRRRSELHYGAFTRRVALPEGIDADAARAILRNGVLEIRIPLHRREPRRVPVQHAS